MNQEQTDQVASILSGADESGTSLVSADDSSDADASQSDILETAQQARTFLESTDPPEILEAVGFELDDDTTDSIPTAIVHGEPDRVEDLQRLLSLAKLADSGDEETLGSAVSGLRESIGEREQTDEPVEDEDSADDFGEKIRSALGSSFEGVGDDLQQLQDRLEEASSTIETGDDETDETETDETDETEADDTDGEEAEERGEQADEGLLETDLGTDQDEKTFSRGVARHSTTAPSPSKRADMRGTARFSTMPDKNTD
ncbi:hypothetical protein ACLI4Z_14115 [Natrialbaceae archaeon A-arb3/5]